MSISISNYVKITSGVGGGNNIRARDLILRIFTPHHFVSPDAVLEFPDAESVAGFFGYDSEEYLRAVKYFGYISNNIVQPQKISFARDQSEVSPPIVVGGIVTSLSEIKSLTGAIVGNVDGERFVTSNVNFSSAVTFADIALSIEELLRATDIHVLSRCVIEFSPIGSRFIITGGEERSVNITFEPGAVEDGLRLSGAYSITGIDEPLSESESVNEADDISNNYGSFLFLRDFDVDHVVALAESNAAKNVMFMYLARCTISNARVCSEQLLSIASVALTLVNDINTDFDDQIPGTLMAATNYEARNGVINYMFKQLPGVQPKVSRTTDALELDSLRVNYYGRTQTAGQNIDFYQRGVLMGGATAPVDMNIHANEQWLKDACTTALMTLLMSLSRISANDTGRTQILGALQDPIARAIKNGTISTGKSLSTTQKIYVAQVTGDDSAWHQVEASGYWIDAKMTSFVTQDGRTEWQCVYTLIYGKDDAIRKVVGTHAMI